MCIRDRFYSVEGSIRPGLLTSFQIMPELCILLQYKDVVVLRKGVRDVWEGCFGEICPE
jgi:hypothetical protein